MTKPAVCFLSLFFLVSCQFIIGQSNNALHIGQLERPYALNPYLYIYVPDDDNLLLKEVVEPATAEKFIPFQDFLDQHYPNRKRNKPVRLDPGKTYWGRVTLMNTLPANFPVQDWILLTGKSNRTVVYAVQSDKAALDTMLTGFMVPASLKDYDFGNQQNDRVRLRFPAGDTLTIYIKVLALNKRKPWIDLRLMTDDFYHNWGFVKKTRRDGVFMGFLLTFAFFSLLLFLVTRDKAFLNHSLFQFGIFVYMLETFYVLYDLPWLRENPFYC